jgi:lipopolysaccharide biosynthesis protein
VFSLKDFRKNLNPGPLFEDGKETFDIAQPIVRLIAYYLPQFHRMPENDQWWGRGFTEWSNITRAYPRFRGHYQPHLPGGLGFYDLRVPEVLYEQAALARRYGLFGFCIHHYWFNGRNLLGEPLRILLENRDIDINFCLNWANENWTSRWDGKETNVLIAQQHSPADDLALARSLEKALSDPRYIRVNGRPLLMIYRPGILPDSKATVERWRNHFVQAGYGDPYMVMPQAFGDTNPYLFGMDAAAGFPPHESGFHTPELRRPLGPRIRRRLKMRNAGVLDQILSYDTMMLRAVKNCPSGFPLLPGVCPSWDNHARRRNGGAQIFDGASPPKYGKWLRAACEYSLQKTTVDERIVFINAWNEWAEGAHLEPDLHFGYAYLAETARTLCALAEPASSELTLQGALSVVDAQ